MLLTADNLDFNEAKKALAVLAGVAAYEAFKTDLASWVKIRDVESHLLLKMIVIIKQQLAVPYDRHDKPLIAVPPPQGSGHQFPVDPKRIKNKVRHVWQSIVTYGLYQKPPLCLILKR